MIFRSKQSHKGFILQHEFRLDSEIALLTGKNGVGKTRFLEGVSCAIEVWDGDRIVQPGAIKFIRAGAMQGSVKNGYYSDEYKAQAGGIVSAFNSSREFYASPLSVDDYAENMVGGDVYSPCQLHKYFSIIAERLGKSVKDLTATEINLFFKSPVQDWDDLDIGRICNEYLTRRRNNSFSRWLGEVHGQPTVYLKSEEFDTHFGAAPWILYDEVLREIFDGKISLQFPEDEWADQVYAAQLVETVTGGVLSPEGLSSGEKNLLWLASALFNLRYGVEAESAVPEIILLDEPDAFLHPKMVVKFYSVIQLIAESFGCKILFTTHSPTTVALAPDGCVYRVAPTSITAIEKDEAISDLLDGVTQISLSAQNRREVFVENKSDANAYRYIFDKIKSKFPRVDPKISLTFFSAGAKMSAGQIEQKINQFLPGVNAEDIRRFTEELNGVGDSGQVIAMVESLTQAGNATVRGVIDWDLKNRPRENIVVSGLNVFYTIENIMLNPLYLIRMLYGRSPDKYPLSLYCGRDVGLRDWMDDSGLLQISIDSFFEDFLGRPNNKNTAMEFLGGQVMYIDSEYLLSNGHDLMGRVLRKYSELKFWAGKDGRFLFELVKVMVDDFGWKHVPCCLEDTFSALQS